MNDMGNRCSAFITLPSEENPCYHCPNHKQGCHNDCPEYADYKRKLEEHKQFVKTEAQAVKYDAISYRKFKEKDNERKRKNKKFKRS